MPPPEYAKRNPITGRYDDAAHRISETINMILFVEGLDAAGSWVTFGLDDGRRDTPTRRPEEYYTTKNAAIRHWRSPRPMIVYQIQPDGCTPKSAALWLTMQRQLYDNGYRLRDERDAVIDMPFNLEDLRR